jgi:hypothetical protein
MVVPWQAPPVQVTSHAQASLQLTSPQLLPPEQAITHCASLWHVMVPHLESLPAPQSSAQAKPLGQSNESPPVFETVQVFGVAFVLHVSQ